MVFEKHQRGLVIDVDGGTPRKRRARSSFLARTGVKRQRWYIRERRIVITEAGLKTRGSIRPCEARSSISIVVSGSRRCLPLSTPAISFYWYRLREKFIGSARRPDRSSIPTKIEEKTWYDLSWSLLRRDRVILGVIPRPLEASSDRFARNFFPPSFLFLFLFFSFPQLLRLELFPNETVLKISNKCNLLAS